MYPAEESINNYLKQIASILKQQRLPENLPEGVVELYIVLDKAGSVIETKILKSDSELLNKFIDKILQENNPYGDFPEEYQGSYINFILPFVFKYHKKSTK